MGGLSQGRSFHHQAGVGEIRLCSATSKGQECTRDTCRWDHDLSAYLAARQADIQLALPTSSNDLTPVLTEHRCPSFDAFGECSFGFKCRFGSSHMRKVADGEGMCKSGWELIVDQEKVDAFKARQGEGIKALNERGEGNFVSMDKIKFIRGQGGEKEVRGVC